MSQLPPPAPAAAPMASPDAQAVPQHRQHVVVMRHGDRIDNFEPLWVSTAARPWDPPLVEAGVVRAFCTGRKLRDQLGFPIHRALLSPFLRCVQTASEVVSALCAVDDDLTATTSKGLSLDPSRVKVSIEYGLCELLNRETIRFFPKDGEWGFDISELEAMLPTGTVDHTVERVYKQMPQWEETVLGARARYEQIIVALADKYPSENLLLVTHGEGVIVSVSAFLKDATVYEVEYCGYSNLERPIFLNDESFTAGNFELLTNPGQAGVSYLPSSRLSDGL
ncbi:hypothetical protein NL676_011906 [Syzygium grande]|nr:hypothetical protein NL676_011906 [Syzygium grande]